MSIISLMVSQLSNHKTLQQEIVEVLKHAIPKKMSSAEILSALPYPIPRQTVTQEIYKLSQVGTIRRAGEIPSPPGTPRQTVAVYTLPQDTKTKKVKTSIKEH